MDSTKRVSRPLAAIIVLLPVCCLAQPITNTPSRQTPPSVAQAGDEFHRLRQQAAELSNKGDYLQSIKLLEQLLGEMRAKFPEEDFPDGHEYVARTLQGLAHAHFGAGHQDRSSDYFKQTLDMRRRLYGTSDHPLIEESLRELGNAKRLEGVQEEAVQLTRSAVDMSRRLNAHDSTTASKKSLAASLRAYGLVLVARGDYTEAENCLTEGLEIRRTIHEISPNDESRFAMLANLYGLGALHWSRGRYEKARPLYEETLQLERELYPFSEFPFGHPAIATSLNNLGAVLEAQGDYLRAAQHFNEALQVLQATYRAQKFPKGHPALLASFNNLGVISQAAGNWEEARDYFERAVEMAERLYPEQDYPNGRRELLVALNGLAALLLTQGEYTEARTIFERTLGMAERLYSGDQYPSGHPQIVEGLSQLGHVHQSLGDHAQAVAYFTRALEGAQRLYGSTSEGGGTGSGHPELIRQLRNLGLATALAGDLEQAETLLRRARQAAEEMFPDEAYPQGHVQRATTLQHLARVLSARGKHEEAREVAESMLQMRQRMYPEAEYSRGHPWIATSLRELAAVLHAQQNWTEAAEVLVRVARMEHALAEAFFAGVSEAEALNFTAQNLDSLNRLLSLAPAAQLSPGEQYEHVWLRRGLVERLMRQRQLSVTLPQNDPALQATYDEYLATRRALAQLTFSPAGPQAGARLERLRELTATKERLERQLADGVPDFRTALHQAPTSYHKLLEQMPDDAIFIDIVHYGHLEFTRSDEGSHLEQRTPRYAAFVMRAGGEPLRVELGAAVSLDAAVGRWRSSILSEQQDDAAADVAARVFAPLAMHIPPETRRIYIAPEGSLSTIPWAALPIAETGELLLEKYAIALCPHGHYLLEQLTAAPTRAGPAHWLLVGDVAYDEQQEEPDAEEFAGAAPAVELQRSPARGDGALRWSTLQGTREELDAVQAAAHAQQASVTRLSGTKATTARLMHELPQARRAHIATHGFFADRQFRSALQLDPRLFESSVITSERTSVAARNPLLLSGLVLAGANLPRPTDAGGIAYGDGGILTAEAIAALPLHRLELIVLSACETGPIIGAGGEGVFGLQRAFHTAGAQNVVASLWKVDDRVTAKLMERFYRHLTAGKTPLEALRAAQLDVLHDPSGDSHDATRAPNLSQTGRLDPERDRNRRAATRLWAGFVLSGAGQ